MPGARVLSHPVRHDTPFPFFVCAPALGPEVCGTLEALFDADLPWQDHQQPFYRVEMAEVTAHLDPGLCRALVARMAALTGLPLTERVTATIQRMRPGQFVGVHTDRPLLGYEAARLVVQLNPDWQPAHGGVLCVHPDAEGARTTLRVPPRYDAAFGFALRTRAHHSVSPVHALRRTAVFNFWHVGNTEALRHHVEALFATLSFAELPESLDPVARQAEALHPEEQTHRAAMVATALQRWGLPERTVIAGYAQALDEAQPEEPVLRLARWAVRLKDDCFDLDAWAQLAPTLARHPIGDDPSPEAATFRSLAFPATSP